MNISRRISVAARSEGSTAMTHRTFNAAVVAAVLLGPLAGVGFGAITGVLETRDPDVGGTAVHWAARLGAIDVLETLVAAGANVDARDADGETPLHWVARGPRRLAGAHPSVVQARAAAVVEALLRLGGNAHARTGWMGATPLHVAAEAGADQVVDVLLAAGVSVEAADDAGATAVHWAARADAVESLSALLAAGASVKATTDYGETAVHWAARADATDTLPVLIAAGASVEATAANGATAVHWAAGANAVGALTALLAAQAPVETVAADGETAVHWAARTGAGEALTALAKAGADMEPRTERWNATPLHVAVDEGGVEGVEALLAAGVDVNAQDNGSWTPMHWFVAVRMFRGDMEPFEIVRFMQVLLGNGADANATNDLGEHAIELLRRFPRSEPAYVR